MIHKSYTTHTEQRKHNKQTYRNIHIMQTAKHKIIHNHTKSYNKTYTKHNNNTTSYTTVYKHVQNHTQQHSTSYTQIIQTTTFNIIQRTYTQQAQPIHTHLQIIHNRIKQTYWQIKHTSYKIIQHTDNTHKITDKPYKHQTHHTQSSNNQIANHTQSPSIKYKSQKTTNNNTKTYTQIIQTSNKLIYNSY